ncbi:MULTISPECIES: helix-turn-helix domain-containing protein [Thermoanaerobacter]|jgi:predicted transposase/invertase (TIGR01784 family)|uniref:helix-turn-helix domain-containing protein n=1 Tax=Thermoanaerobacter TaxID=1754 RepID=UPI0000E1D6CA|nr:MULTISPECIES: helix-turn-helix domain-containing protein [Thermoanaerobacter]ABY93181.1 hypothetical protein Teth514_1901 [Thermoanaerobacter sp. X514]KUJ90684.1 MAG: hypothetical protein XD37_1139 [Thermoanaerobacter thermocopriae]
MILEKGIEKEIEKDVMQEKIAIVKEMLKEGIDIDKIAKITKLPVEEIKKLLN